MTTTGPPTLENDLFERSLYRDGFPHPLFARLRAESPIHRQDWSGHQPYGAGVDQPATLWHAFGQPEVRQINRDWETFTARGGPTVARGPEGGAGMLSIDPPEHHRLRQVVSSAFTPRMIARLEEQIDARVEQLLEPVAGEVCDFVEALAYPLPMHVIADIIGIPESDRAFVFERTQQTLDALDPDAVPTDVGEGTDLYTYAMELGAAKRATPTDDVWSTIIASGLPDDDVALFFLILSIAGSETTRNALSHGLLALLADPGQLARIDDDPTLLGRTGTDEILRYTSPVLVFARDATTDIEVAGATIEQGDRILMWYGVANRDPNVFADPDTFDLDRDPNPHVAFGGGGPHYCLGANLAKREITSMFTTLAGRFGRVEPAGDPVWGGPGPISNVGCSLTRLPVRLVPSE